MDGWFIVNIGLYWMVDGKSQCNVSCLFIYLPIVGNWGFCSHPHILGIKPLCFDSRYGWISGLLSSYTCSSIYVYLYIRYIYIYRYIEKYIVYLYCWKPKIIQSCCLFIRRSRENPVAFAFSAADWWKVHPQAGDVPAANSWYTVRIQSETI